LTETLRPENYNHLFIFMTMKNLRQKLIFRIAISIILIIGASRLGFSQTEVAPKLSKFLILVETTNDGIKLTSQERTAWKDLTFTLKPDNAHAIDQYGMTSLKRDQPAKDSNLSNFLFTIKKTKDGLSFEGIEGTSWKSLSFSCPKSKCHQYIDQNGMTEMAKN
jgi:hypothetical protein